MTETNESGSAGVEGSEYLAEKLEPTGFKGLLRRGGPLSKEGDYYGIISDSGTGEAIREKSIEYHAEGGEVSFADEYNFFRVKYLPSWQDRTRPTREMYYALHASQSVDPNEYQQVGRFRQITELTVTHRGASDSQKEVATLDIIQLLPGGWRIEVEADSLSKDSLRTNENKLDTYKRVIILRTPINHPFTVLDTLFQIGRLRDLANTANTNPKYFQDIERIDRQLQADNQFLEDDDLEKYLRAQRNAWSFALRKIKPFLSDNDPRLNRKAVLQYVHHYALAKISRRLSAKRKHTLRAFLAGLLS